MVQYSQQGIQQDTLKVSGSQVSPTEIEIVLRAHPKGLIDDVIVAGVSGGHTPDEKVPRAWLVLSDAGSKMGAEGVKRELEAWTQDNLSRHKWLRGGIQIVAEVRSLEFIAPLLKVADGRLVGCRSRNR